MDDEKIIELYFERIERAIDETAAKYGRFLNGLAYNVLYSFEDAEECVNDTYMKTWNAIPPSRPTYFQAFIAKITRNLALDRYREKHREKRGGDRTEECLDELLDCIPSEDFEEALVEDMELSEALNGFLAGLNKESRVIFMRRYWYMNSVKEISEELKVGESKVKMQLSRTRERLREYLEKEGIAL